MCITSFLKKPGKAEQILSNINTRLNSLSRLNRLERITFKDKRKSGLAGEFDRSNNKYFGVNQNNNGVCEIFLK
jgi:hypothetical protein